MMFMLEQNRGAYSNLYCFQIIVYTMSSMQKI